ncbi:hypothetical protein GCM10027578_41640 [Spirosoma luteolum]
MKTTVNILLAGLVASLLLLGCQRDPDIQSIYSTLKPGEARLLVQIDGKDFYPAESAFKGEVFVFDTHLQLNVTDQYESNVIISFNGDKWYAQRPVKRPVVIDNQVAASAMIGRLIDPVNRRGEGYLMTDGTITVESLSADKLVMRLDGRVGKYEYQKMPEKWNQIKGLLVYRSPKLTLQNVTAKEVYF